MEPNIALIHATYAALPPVERAFLNNWPEATITSVVAEDLTFKLNQAGCQNKYLSNRITQLTNFATQNTISGILYTCSAFAKYIEAVQEKSKIPILKPNEAMFEEALEIGGRIGMLVTFKPAIPSMISEFNRSASKSNKKNTLEAHYVPDALEALNSGNTKKHNMILAQTAERLTSYDIIMLAQFSMSEALHDVEDSKSSIFISE